MRGHLSAAVWIALTACGRSDAPQPRERLSVTADTTGGVERLVIRGEARQWRLDQGFTLGSLATAGAPADDEFAWVSSVSVGPDDNLYVADIYRDQVLVFDPSGAFLAEFGREGEGPGEFGSLYSTAWVADTLLALDVGNARLGRRSPDGNWLTPESAPGRLAASPVTFRLYQVGPAEVYQWAYTPDEDVLAPSWKGHGTAGGREWGRTMPPTTSAIPDKVVCTRGRGVSWFDHPFATRALAHPGPGGTAFHVTTDRYQVVQTDDAGDTLRVIERAIDPVPLVDTVWDDVAAAFATWLTDKDRTQCEPHDLERPATKPPVEGLMVDVVGRLWVERNLVEGTLWEVFQDGALIGSVPGFNHDRQRTVPWLGKERIAWVTRDALDVPYVHAAYLRP